MADLKELISNYTRKYPATIAWRVYKHCEVIEQYLNPGEYVTYAFCGQKNDEWYSIFDSCVVALTNKRLLIGRKRLLWGSNYMQVTPDLYNDMEVYSGMFFGKIHIDTIKEQITISDLSKSSLSEIETNISEFMINAKTKNYAPKEQI